MTRLCYFICLVLFATQTSSNIVIPCDGDADCEAIVPTSICSAALGNHCTCPAGFTFSTSVTACIREALYGEACAEAIQCSHMLTGAECKTNCQCAEGLTYVRGKCRKLVNLNEDCRDEIDCFFGYNRESVECRDGKCQCAVGFYQRFNNVCRRESINGEPCIVNADCVESNLCFQKKCASVGTQTSSLVNRAVQTSQSLETVSDERPVKSVKSSSFPTKVIQSNIKYHRLDNHDVNRFSSPDDEDDGQFGDFCEAENKPCPGLRYSICRRGFCHCQDGFFHVAGVCKAELGELVENENDCGGGVFRNNRCVCNNDQFYNANMRACVKAADGLGFSCTQQSQCTPYGASLCTGTVESPNNRRCFCHDYAKFNNVTELCEMKERIGEYCQQAATCKVANTVCSAKNTCECKPNFVAQNDEECKPAFGAECEATEDCAFENAECKVETVDETKKTCKCKEDFVGVNNKCLDEAKNYNDTCEESEQCVPLLGAKASCIENHCTCDESLHYKNGKCHDKKVLNDRCSKTAECFVESDPEAVECRNGICQCKLGVTPDTNQNSCIRPREKNSSNKTSPLKVITLALIASAVVITGSALKDAYFP